MQFITGNSRIDGSVSLSNSNELIVGHSTLSCWGVLFRFVETSIPKEYGHHFANDIFKDIFVHDIILYFDSNFTDICPQETTINSTVLVQTLAWSWPSHDLN